MFDHSFYLIDTDALNDEKSKYTEFGSRINDLFLTKVFWFRLSDGTCIPAWIQEKAVIIGQ